MNVTNKQPIKWFQKMKSASCLYSNCCKFMGVFTVGKSFTIRQVAFPYEHGKLTPSKCVSSPVAGEKKSTVASWAASPSDHGYFRALTSPAWPLIESVVLAELRWTLLRPYKTCKPQWRGLLEPADPEDVKRAERHLGQRVGACVRRKGDKVENPWGASKC